MNEEKSFVLLKFPPRDVPVYLIIRRDRADLQYMTDEHLRFLYDEHTCPINWSSGIEAFILDGDSDPHGVAEFVASCDVPEHTEGVTADEFEPGFLFPEHFKSDEQSNAPTD